jgi:hypothetical protein
VPQPNTLLRALLKRDGTDKYFVTRPVHFLNYELFSRNLKIFMLEYIFACTSVYKESSLVDIKNLLSNIFRLLTESTVLSALKETTEHQFTKYRRPFAPPPPHPVLQLPAKNILQVGDLNEVE